jgi:hypothetical protein
VVEVRFRDFVRKLFRHQRRYQTDSSLILRTATGRSGQWSSGVSKAGVAAADEAAIHCEQSSRVEAIVKCLDARMQHLWDLLVSGFSLVEIADRWRVPYDRVRRWRGTLLAKIGARANGSRNFAPVFFERGE